MRPSRAPGDPSGPTANGLGGHVVFFGKERLRIDHTRPLVRPRGVSNTRFTARTLFQPLGVAALAAAILGASASAPAVASVETPRNVEPFYPATACHTPVGSCWLAAPVPAGSLCTCFTLAGPVVGRAG